MNTTLFDLLSYEADDMGLVFGSHEELTDLGMEDSETLATLTPEGSASPYSSPSFNQQQQQQQQEEVPIEQQQQFQGLYFHAGAPPTLAEGLHPQEGLHRPAYPKGKTGKDGLKASSKAKTMTAKGGARTSTPTPASQPQGSPAQQFQQQQQQQQQQQPVYDPQQQFQQFTSHYPGYPAMQFPRQLTPQATPAAKQPTPAPVQGQFFTFTSAQEPAPLTAPSSRKPTKPQPPKTAAQPQASFQFISETPYPAKKGKTQPPPAAAAPAPPRQAPAQAPPAVMKQEVLTPPQTTTPSNFSSPVAATMITPPMSEHDISHSSNSSSSSENGDPQEISPSGSPTISFILAPNVSAGAYVPTKEEHHEVFEDEDEDEDDDDVDDEDEGVSKGRGQNAPKPLFDSFKISSGGDSAKVRVKEERDEDLDKMQRHKKSERRRREKVNDSIATLRTIVPSLHAVQKPSKGTILLKTVEYVSRIQTKHAEATRQLTEATEKITMQQNYINLLIQRLTEKNIPIPGSPEDFKQAGRTHAASTQYFVQDAGRTMVLMAALLFFWYAPWHLPTMQGGGSSAEVFDVTSGRSLLSTPSVVFQMEGWLMFFVWIFIRWVVMTTLLTIALFSDTFYCSPEMKKSQESVSELNRQAKECIASGNYIKASRLTNEALLLLQRPIPSSSFDIFFGIIYQAGRQIAHRAYVGLVVDRLLTRYNGQLGYATQLKDTYLNLCSQIHCLPNYNKWVHLYVLLCAVNLSEIAGNAAEDLVQAYSGLAYMVIIHSNVFQFFANIYMFLAFRIINLNEVECSRFGHLYIIVAYRHLLSGNFDKVFESIQKAMDTHKSFGLHHHYRQALMMKAWIQATLGHPRESLENFKAVYDSGNKDSDKDSKMWGIIGMIANLKHLGENEKALEWLQSYNVLAEDATANSQPNNHQTTFIFGFKSSLYLREGNEEGALEVANQGLAFMKGNPDAGMPHNVLPLQKFCEVHLALLEKFQRMSGEHAKEMVEKLTIACQEDLDQMQKSIVLFPLMRPLFNLYQGRFTYLTTGDYDKAANLFHKCEDSSKKFALRYLLGLAQLEWARIMPISSVERIDKLEEALAIFIDIEALYEEQLTRQEMKRKTDDDVVDRVFSQSYHDLS